MNEHGHIDFVRKENVIILKAEGPWNQLTVDRYASLYKDLVTPLLGSDWASLVIMYGESLMYPQAEAELLRSSKWRVKNGLKALAYVILDSDIRLTIINQSKHVYEKANVNHAFFNDIDSAISWLESNGFEVDQEYLEQKPNWHSHPEDKKAWSI